ncbi:uncharacterized protein B0H64DRAFT_62308 [Chaetomium fimeti]|uniref:Secreted protein n=1 Tax=Chaetomium fimeti TaxID=1854472 RepID=A0AAE0LLY2_9PEZI|nr:hypothetical protein B0H64DRAFT_62308 [Chaetomium fimeti]
MASVRSLSCLLYIVMLPLAVGFDSRSPRPIRALGSSARLARQRPGRGVVQPHGIGTVGRHRCTGVFAGLVVAHGHHARGSWAKSKQYSPIGFDLGSSGGARAVPALRHCHHEV